MIGDLKSWGADRARRLPSDAGGAARADSARFDEASRLRPRGHGGQQLGDAALALRLRIERRTVAPLGERNAARWEELVGADRRRRALGEAGAVGRPLAAGSVSAAALSERARARAAARQAALDGNQPVAYLMACLLIAERMLRTRGGGRRSAVIEVLLTCKGLAGTTSAKAFRGASGGSARLAGAALNEALRRGARRVPATGGGAGGLIAVIEPVEPSL
ncbi:MAG: hypothetical protein H6701_13940 [Myxococcales bacterium]|nr:hypothetical protein [Myxococcales bacterium]